jgi:hypothetical protein
VSKYNNTGEVLKMCTFSYRLDWECRHLCLSVSLHVPPPMPQATDISASLWQACLDSQKQSLRTLWMSFLPQKQNTDRSRNRFITLWSSLWKSFCASVQSRAASIGLRHGLLL